MGQAKCVNWPTGSAKNTDQEVSTERRRRTIRSIGVVPPDDGCVGELWQLVAPNLPTGAKKGRGAAHRRRDVVMEASSPEKFAIEEALGIYG